MTLTPLSLSLFFEETGRSHVSVEVNQDEGALENSGSSFSLFFSVFVYRTREMNFVISENVFESLAISAPSFSLFIPYLSFSLPIYLPFLFFALSSSNIDSRFRDSDNISSSSRYDPLSLFLSFSLFLSLSLSFSLSLSIP